MEQPDSLPVLTRRGPASTLEEPAVSCTGSCPSVGLETGAAVLRLHTSGWTAGGLGMTTLGQLGYLEGKLRPGHHRAQARKKDPGPGSLQWAEPRRGWWPQGPWLPPWDTSAPWTEGHLPSVDTRWDCCPLPGTALSCSLGVGGCSTGQGASRITPVTATAVCHLWASLQAESYPRAQGRPVNPAC